MSDNHAALVETCLQILTSNQNVIDSYITGYFTEELVNELPEKWIDFQSTKNSLQIFLNQKVSTPSPLSLLSFIASCRVHIPQCPSVLPELQTTKKEVWRGVKAKKKHEITNFVHIVVPLISKSSADVILDVGGGLGHLARFLALNTGKKVIVLEIQSQMAEKSKKMTEKIVDDETAVQHISYPFTTESVNDLSNILKDHEKAFIVGLHCCGSLTSLMLQCFKKNANVCGLAVVGCCYMKTVDDNQYSFPLSQEVKDRFPQDKFESMYTFLELACHPFSAYMEKLEKITDYSDLKGHCFRAAIQGLIPVDKRETVKLPVPNVAQLSFPEYLEVCFRKLGLSPDCISSNDYDEACTRAVAFHQEVAFFYLVRLFMGPVVERLIHCDRLLYLAEGNGFEPRIDYIFDPTISPRNALISCLK